MTSQTITIPAREVRPGDVLFGMPVEHSNPSGFDRSMQAIVTRSDMDLWLVKSQPVTVERPVPSDPIGTVRADLNGTDLPTLVYVKTGEDDWEGSGQVARIYDNDVADFPILWKPGMPIPNTEVTA